MTKKATKDATGARIRQSAKALQRAVEADAPDAEIAERLQFVRNCNGLSQKEMSDILGLPLRTYRGYERGEQTISVKAVLKLDEKFGIDPSWTLKGQSSRPPIDTALFGRIVQELTSARSESGKFSFEFLAPVAADIYNVVSEERDPDLFLHIVRRILSDSGFRTMLKGIETIDETIDAAVSDDSGDNLQRDKTGGT